MEKQALRKDGNMTVRKLFIDIKKKSQPQIISFNIIFG